MAKAKTIKRTTRTKLPRERNAGTMTNAMFWSFIRSALRNKSRWWKPITQCRMNSRRAYKGTNKRQKFEYQCNKCKNWFPDKQIAVDHKVPAGSLNSGDDLKGFVERLFCEQDNLQVLCTTCHDKKTLKEKQSKKKTL
jgi:5-methylcytosine-specific restriction endonuclease McrA